MIDQAPFKSSFAQLLAEAFGVSPAPTGSFLDTGQSGLLGMIAGLDAATASQPLPAGEESIAGHCGHVLYLLKLFDSFERNEPVRPDWEASWRVSTVEDDEWQALQEELRAMYEAVVGHLQRRTEWPAQALGAWLMLLPHVAYHVGVVDKMRALT